MRTAIIGTVGVPANYGGFETLVEQLISNKKHQDIHYTIYCSSPSYNEKMDKFLDAKLEYVSLRANGIQSIPYDILSLIKATPKNDAILILGVSGCAFLPIYRLFSKKKLIINIDGLEHRRDKWKKWIRKFLKFSEKMAVRYADVIIGDNKGITDYVKDEYGKEALLIEYGGDQVLSQKSENLDSALGKYDLKKGEYALGLCRIEPENNVHIALEAFSKMPDKKLLFIGNWNHSPYARQLKEKFSPFPNITIADAVYDIPHLRAIRENCEFYIHGHSAGGTNPSLIEAMFFSKPILAYDCVYNRATTENQALYFKSPEELIYLTRNNSHDNFEKISKDMSEIANRRYRWGKITAQYENTII